MAVSRSVCRAGSGSSSATAASTRRHPLRRSVSLSPRWMRSTGRPSASRSSPVEGVGDAAAAEVAGGGDVLATAGDGGGEIAEKRVVGKVLSHQEDDPVLFLA